MQLEAGEWILDAGCGTGLLIPFIKDQLQKGGRYLGMDILPAGLKALKSRIYRWDPIHSIATMQANLSQGLPLGDSSVCCVVAHFSIYTLPEEKDRRRVYQEFWRVLKLGGTLVVVNPTQSYDAKKIIRTSLDQLHGKGQPRVFKKYMVYPMTLHLGLKYIEAQLKSGRWHGYRPNELQDEIVQAGFSIEHSEAVYGGSACLVVGKKL